MDSIKFLIIILVVAAIIAVIAGIIDKYCNSGIACVIQILSVFVVAIVGIVILIDGCIIGLDTANKKKKDGEYAIEKMADGEYFSIETEGKYGDREAVRFQTTSKEGAAIIKTVVTFKDIIVIEVEEDSASVTIKGGQITFYLPRTTE